MHKLRKPIQFIITDSGCHEVTSHKGHKDGYPHLTINKKPIHAHQYFYQLAFGKVEKGLVIRHLCNNPKCINISHLKAGTQKENVHDIIRAGNQSFVGENHPKARLNETQVIEIRNSTKKDRQLSEEYGVSRATINRVRLFRTWKYVNIMKAA